MPKKKKRKVKQSAGTLLYREGAEGIEVLIVHASGDSNKNQPWSIPKGVPDDGEELEAAARRETLEETNVLAPKKLVALGEVVYKNGKHVYGFAGKALKDSDPVCNSWEINKAVFVSMKTAKKRLHPAQAEFIDRLEKLLNN